METITEDDFLTEEESLTLETSDITPALADATDEGAGDERETLAATDQQPPAELEEKLEFFFGGDDKTQESAPAAAAGTGAEEPEEAEETTAALAQAVDGKLDLDEPGSASETTGKQPSEELEDNLELFFGEEEESPAAAAGTGAEETTAALAQAVDGKLDLDEPGSASETIGKQPSEELEDNLELFFGEEEEPLEPATEKPEERLETVEDYKSLLKKMRIEFAERENALKQEIESLRKRIQSQ